MPADLRAFVEQAAIEMRKEYERIQERVGEDPGTAGDEGEVNWAMLLQRWLPSNYHVCVKGRVLGPNGRASKQVDVVVLYPEYPTGLLDKKLYLAAGVAAVFECKLTLRREHIGTTIRRAAEFQDDLGLRLGSPRMELYSPIAYGLLAHSHEWQRPGSDPAETIDTALRAEDQLHVDHPRKMLDVLCVADLGTWSAFKTPISGEPRAPSYQRDARHPEGFVTTGFMERSARIEARHVASSGGDALDTTALAIGELLTSQLIRLAYEDHRLQRMVSALRTGHFSSTGFATCRTWDLSVYSADVRTRLRDNGGLLGSVWNEWSRIWT